MSWFSDFFFGEDEPSPPNIAGATKAGIWTDIETLAVRKLVANAAKFGKKITLTVPIFNAAGENTGSKDIAYDFAGSSDIDATRADMEFGAEAADFMTKTMLDVQKKYGLDFVAQRKKELEASDPTGAAVRERLGEEALAGLERGYGLDPGMRREVDQASLGHMAATGNILGSGAAVQVGERRGDAAFRQYQQRLANAASFLSGTTPVAQFGQLSGAQQGASPFNPMGIQQGIGLNPAAGAQGQQFAMNTYNQRMNYAAQQQPIGAQLLGIATGVATGKFTDSLLGP
jgi:hypothetical protein